jgi:hypothetical protein
MRSRLLASLLTVLFVGLVGTAQEKEKQALVDALDLKGLKRLPSRNPVDKPTVIKDVKALAKAFPEKEVYDRLESKIDFAQYQLLFFHWSGSGQDKLTLKVEEKKTDLHVVFHYQRGKTRDLVGHFHLYALPKQATWKVDTGKGK